MHKQLWGAFCYRPAESDAADGAAAAAVTPQARARHLQLPSTHRAAVTVMLGPAAAAVAQVPAAAAAASGLRSLQYSMCMG
jgi:hypothetical protein